jgi:DNA-binding MltR family transcriptional regulator
MARKAASMEDLRTKYDDVLQAALAHESPLICAVVSVSVTEKALVTLLSNFLIKSGITESILNHNGTLGEFSRCANMAYCLGLITDGMRENLSNIAKIRNLFAHSDDFIDFDDPGVKSLCKKLTAPKAWVLRPEKGKEVPGVPMATELRSKSTRQRFASICAMSCMSLISKAADTKHRDAARDTWMSKIAIDHSTP